MPKPLTAILGYASMPEAPAAWWACPTHDLLSALGSAERGLQSSEAESRLREAGPNLVAARKHAGWAGLLLRQYQSPLVLILILAAFVSLVVQEWTEAAIILGIIAGSTLLSFAQEYRAARAVEALQARLALTVTVLRDAAQTVIPAQAVVPGDIVLLSAGNLIPADGVIIAARDFLVSQATLTGESFPVEKRPTPTPAEAPLDRRTNVGFMGTSVRSGTATMLIVTTGRATVFGAIAERIGERDPETDFERGLRRFGTLLMRIMVVITTLVLTANLLLDRPVIDSLLFAVALAVGLTPELLPAIVSVTMAAGARRMAKAGVLVRRSAAIENLGMADILCSDKTGTLTSGQMALQSATDPRGQVSDKVFDLALINAHLETGIENPLDAAIIVAASARGVALPDYPKVDEIPYDFRRKRLTIVVDLPTEESHLVVTKGAFGPVLDCCDRVETPSGPEPLDEALRASLADLVAKHGAEGIRVLGVAFRRLPPKPRYEVNDENGMTLAGFLMFADPPKPGIDRTLVALTELGVSVKIITGDNRHVAEHVARAVGLTPVVISGAELVSARDEALLHLAEECNVFAEADPQQKERIVRALQSRGHSVAYLGDGINDAPALRQADVGISVEDAVDVARESADIVLLAPDFDILRQGIVDGRRTFANTLKYIQITTSANFGNMISMALGTLFLPFLPLTAAQILLNNFLSDIPSLAVASDRVDPEAVARAPRWNVAAMRSYMVVFGLVSTLFDLMTFIILIHVFGADQSMFQTTWFVVSLLTELAVVMVLRTQRACWSSHPGKVLLTATVLILVAGVALPWLPVIADMFGLSALPPSLLTTGFGIVILYVLATEIVKRWFYVN